MDGGDGTCYGPRGKVERWTDRGCCIACLGRCRLEGGHERDTGESRKSRKRSILACSLAPKQQQRKEELGREETESHNLMRDKAAIHTTSTPCLHKE